MPITTEFAKSDGILELRPEGALESGDFAAIAAEVDPFLEANGELRGLLIDAPNFPGWKDFGGFVTHLKFVRGHHEQVRRVAFVSDSAVLKTLPAIGRHFVRAELRRFPVDEREAAMAWLRGDG